jgi:polyphosphate kinase
MSPAEKDEAPSPEEDASKDGPAPVATPEAPAASEPEPAQHPAPVDARVIEDEPPAEHETRNDAQTTSIEIRRPNRFAVALKLIGLGLAELFTGNLTRRSR